MAGYGVYSGPLHYAEKTYNNLLAHNMVLFYFVKFQDNEKFYFSIDSVSHLDYNFLITLGPTYCGSLPKKIFIIGMLNFKYQSKSYRRPHFLFVF